MSIFSEDPFSLFDPSSSTSGSYQNFSSLADLDVSSYSSNIQIQRRSTDARKEDYAPPAYYSSTSSHSSPADGFSPEQTSFFTSHPTPPASSALQSAALNLSLYGSDPLDGDYQLDSHVFENYADSQTYYSAPGLSNKSSMESFTTNGSEYIMTPRRSVSGYSWDDHSTPSSSHTPAQFSPNQMLPGQSPAQPSSMGRSVSGSGKGSPRRDRALLMKASMPTMMEEDLAQPQNLLVSYRMNTAKGSSSGSTYQLPEPIVHAEAYEGVSYPAQVTEEMVWGAYNSTEPTQTQAYGPSPTLLPSADIITEESSWPVNVPTFTSQNAFEDAATRYVSPEFAWNPSQQASGEQMLVAGEAYGEFLDESSSMLLAPPMSMSMRKSRSAGGMMQRKPSSQTPQDLFTVSPQSSDSRPAVARRASQPIPATSGVQGLFGFVSYGQKKSEGLSVTIETPAQSTYSQKSAPATMSQQRPYPSVLAPPTPEYQLNGMATQQSAPRVNYAPEFDAYSTPNATPVRAQVQQQQPQTPSYPVEQISVLAYQNGESSRSAQQSPYGMKRKVSMASASVMQPAYPMGRSLSGMPNVGISGWNSSMDSGAMNPAALENAAPVLTSAPLVHSYSAPSYGYNAAGQPIAPLPSTPRRRVSKAAPKPRTPSTKRRAAAAAPFCSFVNFTAADADKLLTGVAPSGSQKRRRENSGDAGDEGAKKTRME